MVKIAKNLTSELQDFKEKTKIVRTFVLKLVKVNELL